MALSYEAWRTVCYHRGATFIAVPSYTTLNERAARADLGAEICEDCPHRIWQLLGLDCFTAAFTPERN